MLKRFIKLTKLVIFVVTLAVLRKILLNPNQAIDKTEDEQKNYNSEQISDLSDDTNVIIWWTNFIGDYEYERQCDNIKCFFTENRDLIKHQHLLGFIFYGSNMNTTDFPLPRKLFHQWALFHEESPKNIPFLLYEETLSLFNYTSTFSRHSDFPLTFQHLKSLDLLTTNQYFISTLTKNELQSAMGENLAPVLYVQSICSTLSGRDDYIKELSKYIRIDSYGACLNNKKMPESLTTDYLTTIDSGEYYKFIARYKFVIAYENGVCDDYVTEKLWRPLIVGSIPIYYGSPKIKDWLPNNKSAILIQDFSNPKELGNFLVKLNLNNTEYNSYLNHKNNSVYNQITNEIFLEKYKSFSNFLLKNNNEILEAFECDLCRNMYRQKNHNNNNRFTMKSSSSEIINKYKCYFKNKLINNLDFSMDYDYNNVYTIYNYDSLKQGKCEAKLIYDLVTKTNYPFNEEEFNKKLMFMYEHDLC